jgi:superfamily II DNA/RNA helicase
MLVDDLKRGKVQILVSSDAAARSLDLTGIAHVINADVPQTAEDYVHRLGRIGAPEAVGDVFTLMSPEEQKNVAAIERLVGRAIPRVLLPDFDYNMHPTEFQQAVSYGDEPPLTRRVASGLQVAAMRIANPPRGTGAKNGTPSKAVAAAKPMMAAKGAPPPKGTTVARVVVPTPGAKSIPGSKQIPAAKQSPGAKQIPGAKPPGQSHPVTPPRPDAATEKKPQPAKGVANPAKRSKPGTRPTKSASRPAKRVAKAAGRGR